MEEYILQADNLVKQYPGFKLDHVSLKIPYGTIMGFIGRNGAGKTTTLKSLINLIHLDEGKVRMFGKDFFLCERECKERLSFLLEGKDYYQRVKIKKLTEVTKSFYPNWDNSKYEFYLKEFALDENKSQRELSNGMKLKYQLAVALSHQAELLIFDEPTSGLDPVSRDELMEIFQKVVKGQKRSILFSTHITSDLEKCSDQITYISHGRIIMSASKADFFSAFKFVQMDKKDIDQKILSSLISYKEEEGKISGLISTQDITPAAKMLISEPTLEQIMVFYERKDSNETIIL